MAYDPHATIDDLYFYADAAFETLTILSVTERLRARAHQVGPAQDFIEVLSTALKGLDAARMAMRRLESKDETGQWVPVTTE